MAASVPPSRERERYSAEHAFRLRAGLICPLSGSAGYAEVIRHASCKSNLYLQLLGATYYSTTHLRRTCGVGMYLIIRSVRAPATASCALPSRMELDDFISHQHVDPFHHYRDTLCGNRSDRNLLDALLPWAVIQQPDASSSHPSMLSSAER